MEVGGEAPQPRNHSLSSVPDLSGSRAGSPGLRACCLLSSALLGWSVRLARSSLGQPGAEFPKGACLPSPAHSHPGSLSPALPTANNEDSIRGQRHRTRLHNWFLRTLGISTFCDGGFTYLRPACTRTK